MEKIRIGINGFGRIGRLVLRALFETKKWENVDIVVINDTGPLEKLVHLLRYDSIHGMFPYSVAMSAPNTIVINNTSIATTFEKDPTRLNWEKYNVDIVLECTGKLSHREKATLHLERGASKVLIASPAEGADITVVYGVNHKDIKPSHRLVSNASCTTNCLAPIVKVIQETVGLERGYMTTVHAMTGDQNIIDRTHKDLRRARCADMSMIPTSTGATKAIELIFPQLIGKLSGSSIRVPTNNVSLVDFVFTTSQDVSVEQLNASFCTASQEGDLKGVLDVTNSPLVSIDFNHTQASSIVDLLETKIVDKKMARVLAWYDNEWAFAHRMLDVTTIMR